MDKLTEAKKNKAVELFPHVLAGMAVMLDVPVDEFEQWVRGLVVFPGIRDGVQPAGVSQKNPTNGGANKKSGDAAPCQKKLTIKEKLVAAVAEHPDWICTKIAEYIGEKKSSVSGVASKMGIKFPPVPPKAFIIDKIRASQKQNPDCTTRQIADEWNLNPAAVSWAARQHGVSICKSSRRRARIAKENRPHPASYPAGALFYLRDDKGQYLHQSTTGMVEEKTYAWRGKERQLLNCRRTIKLAHDLHEEIII